MPLVSISFFRDLYEYKLIIRRKPVQAFRPRAFESFMLQRHHRSFQISPRIKSQSSRCVCPTKITGRKLEKLMAS